MHAFIPQVSPNGNLQIEMHSKKKKKKNSFDGNNLWLCFPDQWLNLVCDLRRISKENWTFRPER